MECALSHSTIGPVRWRPRASGLESPAPPYPVVLVVDGSVGMLDERIRWATAFAGLPLGSRLRAILAFDAPVEWKSEWMEGTPEAIAELEAWLREARYEGGQDPNPALERAWELAASPRRARHLGPRAASGGAERVAGAAANPRAAT